MKTDTWYLDGLQREDRKVLTAIYQDFAPKIERFIKNNSGSVDDACDVFNEAIMTLIYKARQGKLEIHTSFFNYFYGTCRFIWLKKLEKKRRHVVINEEEAELHNRTTNENIEQTFIDRELQKLFWNTFEKLTENCRTILKLTFEKISSKKIAERLGLASEQYVNKRKFQCKKKLTELITTDPRYKELSYER